MSSAMAGPIPPQPTRWALAGDRLHDAFHAAQLLSRKGHQQRERAKNIAHANQHARNQQRRRDSAAGVPNLGVHQRTRLGSGKGPKQRGP